MGMIYIIPQILDKNKKSLDIIRHEIVDKRKVLCNNSLRNREDESMARAIGNTLQHALFFSRHLRKCNTKCVTVAILLELGIPAKRIGFEYLVQAIVRFHNDPAQAIAKELYHDIAAICCLGVDARQVESAIRAVILDAWDNRNPRVWTCYFPHYVGR